MAMVGMENAIAPARPSVVKKRITNDSAAATRSAVWTNIAAVNASASRSGRRSMTHAKIATTKIGSVQWWSMLATHDSVTMNGDAASAAVAASAAARPKRRSIQTNASATKSEKKRGGDQRTRATP